MLSLPSLKSYLGASAAAMLIFASIARAQDASEYRVIVDSVAVGTATGVANLPVEHTHLSQSTDPTVPARQTVAGHQESVVVTTRDPALTTLMRAWMGANNSGTKNTVQPKTVEIDHVVPSGGPFRYILHDAWPSSVDAGVITIVYQRMEVLH